MSAGDDLLSNFRLQRRNLILISLLLLFFQSSEVTVNKLSLLGNELEIKSQAHVALVIWVIWLYWLARYYQYFRDLGEKGMRQVFLNRMKMLVEKAALGKALRTGQLAENGASKLKVKLVENDSAIYLRTASEWRISINTERSWIAADKARITDYFEVKDLRLSGKELWPLKLRACLHVLFNTRLLSEYMLPFFIAALPLAYLAIVH